MKRAERARDPSSTSRLLASLACAAPLLAAGAAAEGTDVRRNPQKEAYFGDLHIHSALSLDAWAFGVRSDPEDAYRYAQGQAIPHVSGTPIQLQGPPLDFIALTEHANYLGFSDWVAEDADPERMPKLLRELASADPAVSGPAMGTLFDKIGRSIRIPELVVPEATAANTWKRIVELADRYNAPGKFTAFVAYEYTPMPEGQNLHRNVVFRGSRVPHRPFSSLDSENPEDLWAWMQQAREQGSEVLAIPHNANGSNGLMYQRVDSAGRPIDAGHALVRVRNEPVSEVMQIKGQSETHPALSPDDEWADFEIVPAILGIPDSVGRVDGSYARQALRAGLEIEAQVGVNPYRFGMIGASDSHNASSPVDERSYSGKIGVLDGTPQARLENTPLYGGATGLAGVWAEANTREALFDALAAREVFSTSGPRIRVRLFAGWDFAEADLRSDMAARGYARGVPMGGIIAAKPADAKAPTLLVSALRDPGEAPLERLQIVKGWLAETSPAPTARGPTRRPRAARRRRARPTTTARSMPGAGATSSWPRGRIPTSTRRCRASTMCACSRSPPAAGAPSTRNASASPRPTGCRHRSRSAPSPRPSGTRRHRRRRLWGEEPPTRPRAQAARRTPESPRGRSPRSSASPAPSPCRPSRGRW